MEQGVGSGAELKSMWPRFGPVLLYLVYSWLTLGLSLAYLWPKFDKQKRTAQVPSFHAVCGPDKSVRCGPDLGLQKCCYLGFLSRVISPSSISMFLNKLLFLILQLKNYAHPFSHPNYKSSLFQVISWIQAARKRWSIIVYHYNYILFIIIIYYNSYIYVIHLFSTKSCIIL